MNTLMMLDAEQTRERTVNGWALMAALGILADAWKSGRRDRWEREAPLGKRAILEPVTIRDDGSLAVHAWTTDTPARWG